MDPAMQNMIINLEKSSGKKLEEWIILAAQSGKEKHGEIVSYLKESFALGYGYANMVTHMHLGSSSITNNDKDSLIESHYKGKEHFKPLFDSLMDSILSFGGDVDVSPKNNYVSLRRKKQFATLQPASKNRFEIGINLKGQEASGVLETLKPGGMCSHVIKIENQAQINEEVINWIKTAYDNAG